MNTSTAALGGCAFRQLFGSRLGKNGEFQTERAPANHSRPKRSCRLLSVSSASCPSSIDRLRLHGSSRFAPRRSCRTHFGCLSAFFRRKAVLRASGLALSLYFCGAGLYNNAITNQQRRQPCYWTITAHGSINCSPRYAKHRRKTSSQPESSWPTPLRPAAISI